MLFKQYYEPAPIKTQAFRLELNSQSESLTYIYFLGSAYERIYIYIYIVKRDLIPMSRRCNK